MVSHTCKHCVNLKKCKQTQLPFYTFMIFCQNHWLVLTFNCFKHSSCPHRTLSNVDVKHNFCLIILVILWTCKLKAIQTETWLNIYVFKNTVFQCYLRQPINLFFLRKKQTKICELGRKSIPAIQWLQQQ